jgi:hypothetical protein
MALDPRVADVVAEALLRQSSSAESAQGWRQAGA